MKSHFPFTLLTAVLVGFIAWPAHAIEAPEGYTSTNLNTPGALNSYSTLAENEYMAFMPESSLEFSPSSAEYWTASTPLVRGGNVFFGFANVPLALIFKDGKGTAFSEQKSLTFDTASNLTFSTIDDKAINLADGIVSVSNVNDGQSGTVDVLFDKVSDSVYDDYDTASSYGGAIYAHDVALSNNGDVSFSGNYASAYSSSYGGAIYAFRNDGSISGSVTISNNGDVSFSGNYASASNHYSANANGGAIYAHDVTISNNGDISFSGNFASAYDSNNYSDSNGGAIHTYDNVTISNNGNVTFSENYTSATAFTKSSGGAIWAGIDLAICNNGDISFSENYAFASASDGNFSSYSSGGAIWAGIDLAICNNGDISFSRNYASTQDPTTGTTAIGGAIHTTYVTITNNGNVSFSENYASATNSAANTKSNAYAYGGAICAPACVTISNNSNVSFSGNYASASDTNPASKAYGGAIYVGDSSPEHISIISIQGNNRVLFEKNYERLNNSYRLRSIYANYDAYYGYSSNITLSAKTGGDIRFHDSIYVSGDSYFNSDYTDADGNTQNAGGDIIFSGKYAEQHLNEILADNNADRTATAEEIQNSQTSIIEGNAYLNGGRLQIKDGATLNVGGDAVSIAAGSNATLAINDAELVAVKATIEVGESTTLQLSKGATVTADIINIAAGATLSLGDIAITAEASDSMVAAYRLSCLNVINADLTFAAGSTLATDGTGINMTEGSELTFMATSEGEKINLVFTLGAEYSEDGLMQLFSNVDIVKFLMDGKEVDSSTTLMASDFFTGDYINENTTLTYDSSSGNIYIALGSNIPEPTTATLSLLALAGLAARRRRR